MVRKSSCPWIWTPWGSSCSFWPAGCRLFRNTGAPLQPWKEAFCCARRPEMLHMPHNETRSVAHCSAMACVGTAWNKGLPLGFRCGKCISKTSLVPEYYLPAYAAASLNCQDAPMACISSAGLLFDPYSPLAGFGEALKLCRVVARNDQARLGRELLHSVLRAQV